MNKLLKALLLAIVTIPLLYSLVLLIQNYSIRKSFEAHIDGQIGDFNDDFIRCNWNVSSIKIAYPFMDGETGHVSFYEPGKVLWATSDDWDNARTGGTTVRNTTFDELVAMVKEDCEQFKQAKGEYHDKTINWSYSKVASQEEKNADIAESFKIYLSRNYTYQGLELFSEIYGDPYNMSDEEVVALKERIDKEGVDERVYIVDRVAAFRNGYPELTDRQKQIILDKYGQWEHLTDKELADYSARITEDSASGELVLE